MFQERVLDIYQREKSEGVVVSMGGQIPNNIALPLHNAGVKVMGTSPLMIDNAEDREKFSSMLDKLGIQQAKWAELSSPMVSRCHAGLRDMRSIEWFIVLLIDPPLAQDAVRFAEGVGYPVLVRPSYVLSGAGMFVSWNADQLAKWDATTLSSYLHLFE